MKQNELLSYTYDFISQINENRIFLDSVKEIILFGSVARNDFNEKSDIDIFVNIKDNNEQEKIRQTIKKEINKFEARAEKTWHLRNITNPINVIISDINDKKWEDLKDEIAGYGKILYGNYEKNPDKLNHKILITYNLKNISQKNKMSFLRKLNGYSIKKNNKVYKQSGIIEKTGNEKISKSSIIINPTELKDIKKLIKEYKIKYQLTDIWTR